jgi:hypothetical protein
MATSALSIKLRCASWQQLATIYKRDLSKGTMFLKAATPPPLGTNVRIDLTLPSSSVIVLNGVVEQHISDAQRGIGVELKLAPIPTGSIWLIESALASEQRRQGTPASGVPQAMLPPTASGPVPTVGEGQDMAAAEDDLIRALIAEAESLKKLNPFLVLGVGYEANDGDVRTAFGELTKRYHPDRFARYESNQLRQVAAEIFILIRDAYRKIGEVESRNQTLASLGRSAAPRAVPAPRPASQPNVPPPREKTGQIPVVNVTPRVSGVVPVVKPPGETTPPPIATPASGVPKIEPAHTGVLRTSPLPSVLRPPQPIGIPKIPAQPGTPEATAPTTRAISEPPARPTPDPNRPKTGQIGQLPKPSEALPPVQTERKPINAAPPAGIVDGDTNVEELVEAGKLDEALAAYKLLAKKHPNDRTYRAGIELCEGLRALGLRDRLEAAQRFEAALEIDPSNERAARELAEMRRQATNERKGLLSRLMGKKEP